jgi:hypothetical protein
LTLITRLLAAELFYDFGFLAISLALMGLGAGSIFLYLRPGWVPTDRLNTVLARWCAALAVLLLLVPIALVRLRFGTSGSVTLHFSFTLAILCAIAALPFTAAGIVVALAVKASTEWLGRLYACDLAGAAVGSIATVPLMWVISVPTLLVALGAVAAAASLLAADARRERIVASAMLVASAAAIALSATTHLYYMPPVTTAHGTPVADRWGPLNRVVGYAPPQGSHIALLFDDRVYAPVWLWHRGTPLPNWRRLHDGPQSIGYAMTGPGRALIIGGGGGRDIENALTSGARRVDVIELNRDIVDVVDHALGRWSGSPYPLPGAHGGR